ncbi:nicotianamine synthase family protein [Herbivorax sp. ANBcel31]|uniref:nicotianamine synthase family protein n=1 Tax=Herbivorax sp. ANBcel31 TaxID=3069754 RepID=UPI0027B5E636|nr:nicotianamine synthase family protein [Herbivorax sp. ANBcel31]MDQ2086876.1 nicotianamine synthase family protein [Herbivorax sp. ANBcel31]
MKLISFLTKELERIFSKSITLVRFYGVYYKNIVKREVELAGINSGDSVLFIGGGAVPCTALQIASITGAKVKVIDVDPVAIDRTKKIITKLNLSHCVKAQLISGQSINASKFSVIHIARQAVPHNKILENVVKRVSDDTRILLRSNSCCFEKSDKLYNQNCKCQHIKRMKQSIFGSRETFMLTIEKNSKRESEKVNSYTDSFRSGAVGTVVS